MPCSRTPSLDCLSCYLYRKRKEAHGIKFSGSNELLPGFSGIHNADLYIAPLAIAHSVPLSWGTEETQKDISRISLSFFGGRAPFTAPQKDRYYCPGQPFSARLGFQSSIIPFTVLRKLAKDDMDPPDYTENDCFSIAGRDMKYEWLLPFMTVTRRGPYNPWQLLMILWDMDWGDYLHRITLEQVASIKETLDKKGTQCTCFKQCMIYRDSVAPGEKASREEYYERALKDAEMMITAFGCIDVKILRDIVWRYIHTKLSNYDILYVTAEWTPYFSGRWWTRPVSHFFKDKEGQMPWRATEYLKEYWPEVYESVVKTSEQEQNRWVRDAKIHLDTNFITMKNGEIK